MGGDWVSVVDIAREAGIVGAGGAGFPTHVKFNAKADVVLVNGAECEPLLRVDQQLMALYPREVLAALDAVVGQVGAGRGVVALKAKYHEAEAALARCLGEFPRLSLHLLGNFYPARDEQVMVYEVLSRIVPEGGIPLNVSAVVSNVETLLNLYNAMESGQPVTGTYITVTGEVRRPLSALVPVGISVREALELAGGAVLDDFEVVAGGPMMGALTDLDAPVTKTSKGFIVLPKGHSLVRSLNMGLPKMMKQAQTACMQCSLCSEVCPRGLLGHRLEPHKLMRLAAYGDVLDKGSSAVNAFLCCGCRLCEYACVMDLQPWKLNNALKAQMGAKGVKNPLNAAPERVGAYREYKRYPVNRLVTKLGLGKYDVPAPMAEAAAYAAVSIPLKQHVGVPAEACVKVGDYVRKGDLIGGLPDGKLGANVHASIDGRVTAVSDCVRIEGAA